MQNICCPGKLQLGNSWLVYNLREISNENSCITTTCSSLSITWYVNGNSYNTVSGLRLDLLAIAIVIEGGINSKQSSHYCTKPHQNTAMFEPDLLRATLYKSVQQWQVIVVHICHCCTALCSVAWRRSSSDQNIAVFWCTTVRRLFGSYSTLYNYCYQSLELVMWSLLTNLETSYLA